MNSDKLLAIIDYQNDFVCGSLGFSGAEQLDSGIAKLAQEYLARGDRVLITYDTHEDHYLSTREGRALPIPHCHPATQGWQLYGQTQDCIAKTCLTNLILSVKKSAFGIAPEQMINIKKQLGEIGSIYIVGLVTNLCVLSNVCTLQAAWPQAQIIVDASLCASFNPEMHEKTLDVLESMQVNVINRS